MHSWQMLCFDTVARTRNFSEAAKELYISQQALSKQIQKLEQVLGVKLLVRRPKVELTREGEVVHETVVEMLALERRMNQRLKAMNSTREPVHVGMGYTRNRSMLMNFFPWFLAKHPEVDLQITLDKAKDLQKLLLNGGIDFWIGYLAEQNENLEYVDLFEDPLVFLVPRKLLPQDWDETVNPLSALQEKGGSEGFDPNELPVMLLPKGHTIRTNAEAYIRSFGVTPHVILENNDNETLLMLGLNGVGALFAAKSVLARYADYPTMQEMLCFEVPTSLVPQTVSVIYRKNEELSVTQKTFLEACIERLDAEHQ